MSFLPFSVQSHTPSPRSTTSSSSASQGWSWVLWVHRCLIASASVVIALLLVCVSRLRPRHVLGWSLQRVGRDASAIIGRRGAVARAAGFPPGRLLVDLLVDTPRSRAAGSHASGRPDPGSAVAA